MPDVVLRGGTVVDESGLRRADVVIAADGTIAAVGEGLSAERVLDAGGCYVAPGFVDLHTHLREPGREEAETVETGSHAAALGGYTAIVAMPNTEPTIDSASVVREVLELGRTTACDVYTSAAITIGRKGEKLAPMAELAKLGVRFFTDDGDGVQDDRLMRRAMEYAAGLNVMVAQHCEVKSLSEGGYMHEGEWSSRLGIPGQPAEAEELMVMRDIALCRLTGARLHFQHLSTQGSIAMVRAARAGGLPISAEATTHHFTLTDAAVESYDTVYKVHPPLRTETDRNAVRVGLEDGTIEAIATDHAPHTAQSKELPFDQAPPGMLGLETALPLALGELDMKPVDVVRRLSTGPARIARIDDRHGGPIRAGRVANLCVFDPEHTWTVDGAAMASRSNNTPYQGREVQGRVRHTILAGEPVVIDGELQR